MANCQRCSAPSIIYYVEVKLIEYLWTHTLVFSGGSIMTLSSLSPLSGKLAYFCSNSSLTICSTASIHSSSQPMVLKYLSLWRGCRTSSKISYILIQDNWKKSCTHCDMIHFWLVGSRVITVEHSLGKTKCGMDRWLIFRVDRLRGECFVDMVHGQNDCSKRGCRVRKKQCCVFEDLGRQISHWTSVLKIERRQ